MNGESSRITEGAGAAVGAPGSASPTKPAWQEAWVRTSNSSNTPTLKVTMSEPQTTGAYMSKFVTYRVQTQPFGYVVRRRYSDFTWLRKVLIQRYTGMLIPSLPPKAHAKASTASASSSDTESNWVQSRMRLLGIFLNRCCESPYLRGDQAMLAFLSTQNDKDWEAAKLETCKSDLFSDQSVGAINWKRNVIEQDPPHNSDRIILDFRTQLDWMESVTKAIAKRAASLVEVAKTWSGEISAMKEVMAMQVAVENDIGDNGKVEFANPFFPKMRETTVQTQIMFESWEAITAQQPELYACCLQTIVSFQAQQIKAFRELLDLRDGAMKEQSVAQKKLAMYQTEKDQGKTHISAGTFSSKKKPIDEQIAESTADLAHKTKIVDVHSNALFWSEIERFHIERQCAITDVVGQIAAGSIQFEQRLTALFNNALAAQQLNYEEQFANCKIAYPGIGGAPVEPGSPTASFYDGSSSVGGGFDGPRMARASTATSVVSMGSSPDLYGAAAAAYGGGAGGVVATSPTGQAAAPILEQAVDPTSSTSSDHPARRGTPSPPPPSMDPLGAGGAAAPPLAPPIDRWSEGSEAGV